MASSRFGAAMNYPKHLCRGNDCRSARHPGNAPEPPAAKAIRLATAKANAEKLKLAFLGTLRVRNIPQPVGEWKFALHLDRRWRFDFAWPSPDPRPWAGIAVEQEGLHGRHQFTKGFIEDMEKYRTAALLGWTVGRFTTREMTSGVAAEWVEQVIAARSRWQR